MIAYTNSDLGNVMIAPVYDGINDIIDTKVSLPRVEKTCLKRTISLPEVGNLEKIMSFIELCR